MFRQQVAGGDCLTLVVALRERRGQARDEAKCRRYSPFQPPVLNRASRPVPVLPRLPTLGPATLPGTGAVYPVMFHSLFGDVPVRVRCLRSCPCQGASCQSFSTLFNGKHPIAPELSFVTPRPAALLAEHPLNLAQEQPPPEPSAPFNMRAWSLDLTSRHGILDNNRHAGST